MHPIYISMFVNDYVMLFVLLFTGPPLKMTKVLVYCLVDCATSHGSFQSSFENAV